MDPNISRYFYANWNVHALTEHNKLAQCVKHQPWFVLSRQPYQWVNSIFLFPNAHTFELVKNENNKQMSEKTKTTTTSTT